MWSKTLGPRVLFDDLTFLQKSGFIMALFELRRNVNQATYNAVVMEMANICFKHRK